MLDHDLDELDKKPKEIEKPVTEYVEVPKIVEVEIVKDITQQTRDAYEKQIQDLKDQFELIYYKTLGEITDDDIEEYKFDYSYAEENIRYFDLINVEIEKRGVDCSQYKEQVETARSSQQVMGTLTGFMAILFGLLYGLNSA